MRRGGLAGLAVSESQAFSGGARWAALRGFGGLGGGTVATLGSVCDVSRCARVLDLKVAMRDSVGVVSGGGPGCAGGDVRGGRRGSPMSGSSVSSAGRGIEFETPESAMSRKVSLSVVATSSLGPTSGSAGGRLAEGGLVAGAVVHKWDHTPAGGASDWAVLPLIRSEDNSLIGKRSWRPFRRWESSASWVMNKAGESGLV